MRHNSIHSHNGTCCNFPFFRRRRLRCLSTVATYRTVACQFLRAIFQVMMDLLSSHYRTQAHTMSERRRSKNDCSTYQMNNMYCENGLRAVVSTGAARIYLPLQPTSTDGLLRALTRSLIQPTFAFGYVK